MKIHLQKIELDMNCLRNTERVRYYQIVLILLASEMNGIDDESGSTRKKRRI
jgi:hypothetical protein